MRLISGASTYLGSNIFSALIPFILLPILTRALTIEQYGQVAMFQVLFYIFNSFIGLNTVSAANRVYFDNSSTSDSLIKYNSSCMHVLIISVILTSIVMLVLDDYIAELSNVEISWVYYAILCSGFSFIVKFRLAQWQIKGKALLYGIVQVSSSLTLLIFSIIFVIYMEEGGFGRVLGQVLSLSILGIVCFILLYKDKLIEITIFDKDNFLDCIKYGAPLVPHTLGFFLITYVDRLIINSELSVGHVAIYMVAFQFSSIFSFVFDAINKAYTPWLFSKLKKNDEFINRKIVKITWLYFFVLILLSIAAFILMPVLVGFVVGDDYIEAAVIARYLIFGQILGGMYLMVTNYIFYSKNTKFLSFVTILTGLINIVLVMFFISKFGLIGVAYAFVITKFLQFLLTFIVSNYAYPMPWFNCKCK